MSQLVHNTWSGTVAPLLDYSTMVLPICINGVTALLSSSSMSSRPSTSAPKRGPDRRRSIGLAVPLGAKQAGNTLHEPVSIQLLVVSSMTTPGFGCFLWEPALVGQVIQRDRRPHETF